MKNSPSKPAKLNSEYSTMDFIEAIFGAKHLKSKAKPLFCGFPDDPKTMSMWIANPIQDGKIPNAAKSKHNNCYFTVSSYLPDVDVAEYRAKKKLIAATYAILLDDVGTKAKSVIPLKPSWKIKTSEGNYQCGLMLDVPCKDTVHYESVVKALGDKGWSDTGAKGATRWARLPIGSNTKREYFKNGKYPSVELIYLKPKRRYSLQQIIDAFGLSLDAKGCSGTDNSNKSPQHADNTVMSALKAAGLWKSELEPGKHDITCPWVNMHTNQIDHGTVYYEPSLDNKQQGGFVCQHGHCCSRNLVDLKEFLGLSTGANMKKSQVDSALELVDDLPVFHDEKKVPYCFIEGRCLPIRDNDVRTYISRKVYNATGKTLNRNSLGEVLAMLEGKALFEGEQIQLHVRVASHKGYFWYDLGNGHAVKINRKGWEIVESPRLFRRYDHQKIQVKPTAGGDPWKLLNFLNIPKKHRLETLVLVISYLIPDIAHPVIHTHGPKGSAKSTSCILIKRLIDPSILELISSTRDKSAVIQQLSKHHMPVFDNVSKIDSELSDIFCTACTGGGISKRALYTNDGECIYNFKRCIAINGINLLITKADLLDRTMLLHFKLIASENRKEEKVLLSEFEAVKAEILGGMFDTLSKAMRIFPEVNLEYLPRLADFAKWGYAIAEALDKGKGDQFILDYQANVRRQNAEVLQSNSLCLAVTRFMDNHETWTGTVKDAFEALRLIATPDKGDTTFPVDSKNLRKQLELIQSTLVESEGIDFKFAEKRRNDGYHVTFTKNKKGGK